jgi:hypothetical protein
MGADANLQLREAPIFATSNRIMGKLANKRTAATKRVRRSTAATRPRKLLDAKKHAGAIPGMADWALDEVRKMRDEW